MRGLRAKTLAAAISKITLTLAGASVLELGVISQAVAQEDELGAFVLEEILVTATKRKESLQDVPISMSVLGADVLAKTGSVRLDDVVAFVPNVSLSQEQTLAFGEFTIRGLSTASGTLGLSPGVGVYIDEVYMGRGSAGLTDLADIEQVEVLRGPQGTIYGRNTTMGAMNVTTKRPSQDFEGAVDASLGNYNLRSVRGYVTGALLEDTLAGKISINSRDRDGYLENASGPDVNDVDALSARAQLLYTPNDRMEFLWTIDASRDRAVGNYAVATLDGTIDSDEFTRKVDIPEVGHEERDLFGTALRADVDLGDIAFTSITSYRELEFENLSDQDGTPFTLIANLRQEEQEQFSQEFRLVSTSDAPLQWILGLYHYQDNLSGTLDAIVGPDTVWLGVDAMLGTSFFGSGILPSTIGFGLPDDAIIANGSESHTASNAVYGSVTYDLDERASVIGGLRYTKEKRDVHLVQEVYASDPAQTPAALGVAYSVGIPLIDDSESLEDDAFSADLAYTLQLSSDLTVYAKVSHGFKSGGFNVGLTFVPAGGDASLGWDPDMEFQPEKVTSYELGWKSTLLEGAMRLNGAIFYADFRNKQETYFIDGQGFVAGNAGLARTQGLEMEGQWQASEGLNLSFGLGYTDAIYTKFEDDQADKSGNRLPNAPKWTVSGAAEYLFPVSESLEGMARLDFSYQSDSYRDSANTPDFATNELALVNIRLGLQSTNGIWTASLWGKNLLDQDRWIGASANTSQHPGERHYSPINPLTYGLDVSYNF